MWAVREDRVCLNSPGSAAAMKNSPHSLEAAVTLSHLGSSVHLSACLNRLNSLHLISSWPDLCLWQSLSMCFVIKSTLSNTFLAASWWSIFLTAFSQLMGWLIKYGCWIEKGSFSIDLFSNNVITMMALCYFSTCSDAFVFALTGIKQTHLL